MVYGIVYCHINIYNGKVYVGQTIHTLEIRWKQHIRDAKNRPKYPFHNAIKKYGPEGFIGFVLCECITQEEMDEKEVFYTNFYRAWKDQEGYCCKAGQGKGTVSEETRHKLKERNLKGENHPLWGIPVPEERKKRIAESNKGQKRSLQAKENMSKAQMGRKWTKEAIEKRTASQAKTWHLISPKGEKITVFNLNKFCKENGLSSGRMSDVANGKQTHHKGWIVKSSSQKTQ